MFKLNRIVLLSLLVSISLQAQKDTLRIMHITDTHVVYHLDATNPIFANLRKHLLGSEDSLKIFIKKVNENTNADAVVITGDLTDYYNAEISKNSNCKVHGQIEHFKSIYKLSKKPTYLVLGNHDISSYLVDENDSTKIEDQVYADEARALWIKNYSCFRKGTYYKKEFIVGNTKYHFFFLDDGYNLNGKNKYLDEVQLDWLREQLSKIKNEPIVMFFHIYLPVGDINGDGIYFRKNKPVSWPDKKACSKGFLKILNENENIKVLFVGHQHRNVWEEINFRSGNKIYQIQTSALFKSTNNWRLLKFTNNEIIVSKPGSNKTELKINTKINFIPKELNGFKIEVTKPGNEFFKMSEKEQVEKPLPKNISELVKLLSPENSKISGWKLNDDKSYRVFVWVKEKETKYYFTISKEGKLLKLKLKNYSAYQDIQPNNSIIKGSKKNISKNLFPHKALIILERIANTSSPVEYYSVQTPYGEKYLAATLETAYMFNKNGQIQTAGFIKNGALQENDSSNLEILKTNKEVIAVCDSLLKPYRDKFNIEKAIAKIKKSIDGKSQFRFIIMGDSRSNKKVWETIVEHINKLKPKPKFVLTSGDLVRHGYTNEYANYYIPPLLKTDIPYLVAIGNHDDGVRDSALEYQYLFGKNSLNYFFDLGKFRFIMLDNASRNNTHGESLTWLEKVLSETPKEISKIVMAHKPPKIKQWAWHSWDMKDSKKFIDLMTKYKVKYVFLGHIHGYSTATINGIPYTVSGGGGAELRGDSFGKEGNTFHYIICDAMPDGSIKQQIVKFYKK